MKTKKKNKTHRLNFRVSQETFDKLEALSKMLETNNTQSFELSINFLTQSVLSFYTEKENEPKNGNKKTNSSKNKSS